MEFMQNLRKDLYCRLFGVSLSLYAFSDRALAQTPAESDKVTLSKTLDYLKFSGEIIRTHVNQYTRFKITIPNPDKLPDGCKNPREFTIYRDSLNIGEESLTIESMVNTTGNLLIGKYDGINLLVLTAKIPDRIERVWAYTIDDWQSQAGRDTSAGFKEIKKFSKARLK